VSKHFPEPGTIILTFADFGLVVGIYVRRVTDALLLSYKYLLLLQVKSILLSCAPSLGRIRAAFALFGLLRLKVELFGFIIG
jgi:hypothetical protein